MREKNNAFPTYKSIFELKIIIILTKKVFSKNTIVKKFEKNGLAYEFVGEIISRVRNEKYVLDAS